MIGKITYKVLGIVLTLALIVGMLPGTALATGGAESVYDIWINGVQVTNENAGDVLEDGTVAFDSSSNTITLNGAKLEATYTDYSIAAAIFADDTIDKLTIHVTGENKINVTEFGSISAGIYAYNDVVFEGDGSLNVYALGLMSEGNAIYAHNGNATINSGTYSFEGDGTTGSYGIFANNNSGTVYVKGGNLTAIAGRTGSGGAAIGGKLDYSRYNNCEIVASVNASGTPETPYIPENQNTYRLYKYIGIESKTTVVPVYDENGFQTNGDGYEPAQLAGGMYQIENAGNLFWFAQQVKVSGYGTEMNAALVNDITIPEGRTWTPISVDEQSTSGRPYTGTFDGKFYTISGLETEGQSGGLFKALEERSVVKNLGIIDSSIEGGGSDYAGAIAATNYGTIENCYNTGKVTGYLMFVGGIVGRNYGKIQNCYNTGAVTVNGQGEGGGGICGTARDKAVIENCYNTGTVSGRWGISGICGYFSTDAIKITNCYNTGDICIINNGYEETVHGIAYSSGVALDAVAENCYYIAAAADENGGKKEEQFASGEVAWLLNGEKSDGVWGQTLEGDKKENTPSLNGKAVYAGYEFCYSEQISYSNDSGKVHTTKPEHDFAVLKHDENFHWYACSNEGCTATDGKNISHVGTDDGDCTTPVVCEVCKYEIKAANSTHTWSNWSSDGNGNHNHECTVDGCNVSESKECSGGSASYFKKAVCETCNSEYGELLTDTTNPIGEIKVGTNTWNKFLNTITFGMFFKKTQTVTISASDDSYDDAGYTSDKAVTMEYYIHNGDNALTEEELKNASFTEYTKPLGINPNNKYTIYAKITDHAGNITIINTDGIVLYTDSKQVTESICYIKTTKEDVSAKVILNGNTIHEISYGSNGSEIIGTDHYTVSEDGTITFKGNYLDTLAAGTYYLNISYHPLDVQYVEDEGNAAPANTTLEFEVRKASESITGLNDISKTYDGKPVEDITYETSSDRKGSVEYKKKNESDDSYTEEKPYEVGEYTVRVTVEADENYTKAVATKDFEISYLETPSDSFTISDDESSTGWYTGDVTIVPPEGYQISTSIDGTYSDTLVLTESTEKVVIYLKNEEGQVTDSISVGNIYIDKTLPDISVSGNTTDYLQKDTIAIETETGVSGVMKVEVQKDGGRFETLTGSAYEVTENGTYLFRVTNGAGVTKEAAIIYEKLDHAKPVVKIDSGDYQNNTWSTKNVTISVSNQTANLGTTTIQYKVDDGAWQNYTKEILISEDTNGVTYTFKAISASGVESEETSITVRKDTAASTITGLTNGETYYTTQKVEITEENLESITVNGEKVTAPFLLEGNKDISYTIVVTDKAGNKTTYEVAMKPISDLSEEIQNLTNANVTKDHLAVIEKVENALLKVDQTNATEQEKKVLKQSLETCEGLINQIQKNEQTFTLSGQIRDYEGNLVSNVTVVLQSGKDIIATTTTNQEGNYVFRNVKAGIYNIVAKQTIDGITQTMTILVVVKDHDMTKQNVKLPDGKKSSLLEILSEATPNVVVGGLQEIAEVQTVEDGEMVNIVLTVEAKEDITESSTHVDSILKKEQQDIKEEAGSDKILNFIDFTLSLVRHRLGESAESVTNIGNTNTKVLEIVVPYDFTNKHEVTVYRYHEEAVTLRKLLQKPETEFEDGTFYLDQDNGLVYIYASRFSTYAIGYEEAQVLETPVKEEVPVDMNLDENKKPSPATGSHTHETTWFCILIISVILFYKVYRYRKRMNGLY